MFFYKRIKHWRKKRRKEKRKQQFSQALKLCGKYGGFVDGTTCKWQPIISYTESLSLILPQRVKFNQGDLLIYFPAKTDRLLAIENIIETGLKLPETRRLILISSSFTYLNLALDLFNKNKEMLNYISKLRLLCLNKNPAKIIPKKHGLIVNLRVKAAWQHDDSVLVKWKKQILVARKEDILIANKYLPEFRKDRRK